MIDNKPLILLLLLSFVSVSVFSQISNSKEAAVQSTIETFFLGMKKGDPEMLRSTIYEKCSLSTVTKSDTAVGTSETNIDDFIGYIEKKPETTLLDERILSYDINIDGELAIAWTPYEFYVNDNFSHCGVNVFTLINTNGEEWKIRSIIDTRRKENCR